MYSKSVFTLTHQAQLLKRLTAQKGLSCSVSQLSGCALWHSDWLLGKLISQQALVQHTTERRAGSGQPEKETPAAYSSVGWGAALLGGSGGRGECVTLLVRASISVMDELSSKQEMKRKWAERQSNRTPKGLLSWFSTQPKPQTIASSPKWQHQNHMIKIEPCNREEEEGKE